MPNKLPESHDISVVGGGLAGLTAALTLARNMGNTKAKVALIAPKAPNADGRTTALLGQSVTQLEQLGIWDDCQANVAALATMRILDGTKRLWRAPPVEFKAIELGIDAFGYNIANADLADVLRCHIASENSITVIEEMVASVYSSDEQAVLRLENGEEIATKLVIAADGKNSRMREAAGISVRNWHYPQIAIAVNLDHTISHNSTSTEFHTEEGPFTIVPMPNTKGGFQSGIVWVMRPEKADTLLELPPHKLALRIEQTMQSMLGRVKLASKPQKFPLSGMIAHRFAANRVALVGDAAHVFPPIGAQGFNLGLRDVAKICEIATGAMAQNSDPGSNQLLNRYNQGRLVDVTSRTGAVDLLNRSLLTSFLPVQALRGFGLYTLAKVPFLRKVLMQQGLAPGLKPPEKAA